MCNAVTHHVMKALVNLFLNYWFLSVFKCLQALNVCTNNPKIFVSIILMGLTKAYRNNHKLGSKIIYKILHTYITVAIQCRTAHYAVNLSLLRTL